MKVGKIFTFEAAHFLPGHPKCGQMHGHSYRVEVTVEGPVNPNTGMVVDFGLLSEWVGPALENLDHRVLNEKGFGIPTAEHLCLHFKRVLDSYIENWTNWKVGVKVWETATSWAEL